MQKTFFGGGDSITFVSPTTFLLSNVVTTLDMKARKYAFLSALVVGGVTLALASVWLQSSITGYHVVNSEIAVSFDSGILQATQETNNMVWFNSTLVNNDGSQLVNVSYDYTATGTNGCDFTAQDIESIAWYFDGNRVEDTSVLVDMTGETTQPIGLLFNLSSMHCPADFDVSLTINT